MLCQRRCLQYRHLGQSHNGQPKDERADAACRHAAQDGGAEYAHRLVQEKMAVSAYRRFPSGRTPVRPRIRFLLRLAQQAGRAVRKSGELELEAEAALQLRCLVSPAVSRAPL